jgi:glutathione synthase/RimK-type ligase-like ATP-grasp enzyme
MQRLVKPKRKRRATLPRSSGKGAFRGTPRAIVIVTQDIDPHSDVVVLHLKRRGIKPVRFHPQRIGQPDQMTIAYNGDGNRSWTIRGGFGALGSADVGSIWYRRTFFAKNPKLAPHEAEFVEGETRAAVLGMLRMTDAFWVSHPDALVVAESKPYQLKVAQDLGFLVPRTLITNDPARFRAFYEECGGNVIYKPLTQGPLGAKEGKGVFTNRVGPEHLKNLDAIRPGPCLFQEHVPKKFDLRVTAIGRRLFPVAIHSQTSESSRTDWRRGSPTGLKHELCKLPPDIERKCLSLLSRLNLQYGAIDLVLTPDGRHVFLEINPSGQFAWIESLTKLPLVEELCDLLISKC